MVQIFREIAKIHMNVNFRDKDFVIATFFMITSVAPARTIHVVLELLSVR